MYTAMAAAIFQNPTHDEPLSKFNGQFWVEKISGSLESEQSSLAN